MMPARRTLRVGAVSYLNTRPLIYRLQQRVPRAELLLDLPSRLADGLQTGAYDVALIPVIELFREPDYTIVSDACIACRGPVLSVKVFFRTAPQRVRTLALDEGSRTSVVLAQVLLWQQHGIRPQLERLPIGRTLDDTQADAVLLIGDRAIHAPSGPFAAVWDLGQRWCQSTGLPFVFAVWAARQGTDVHELGSALAAARDDGVRNLEAIAAQEAAAVGLPPQQCLAYLRDNLYFYLGAREQQGLSLFRQMAAELNLVPEAIDVASSP
jgi:chorismate dehydratase